MDSNDICPNHDSICHIVRNSALTIKDQMNKIKNSSNTEYKEELCKDVMCELLKIEGALDLLKCSGLICNTSTS